MSALRILIADDHEVVRAGVRSLLESQPDCEICGEAVTGQSLDLVHENGPTVALYSNTRPLFDDAGLPRGAVGAFADGLMEALPPRIDAVCPIGAGDALMAAYAWARERRTSVAEALRWGVAAGTASARLPGMSFASLAQAREIYRQVEVRRVE